MDIYDVDYNEKLFDEMSGTYDTVNYLSSFGFTRRWRKQMVHKTTIRPGMVICDLMCGMGECWEAIDPYLGHDDRLIALDLSSGMLKGAEKRRRASFSHLNIQLLKENVLANTIEDESVNCITCAFGIKTFTDRQADQLACEMMRILKPRGTFSLIEVSVPASWLLNRLYMFYLKNVIPIIGQMLLGNPENYRMLGIYTENFGNCRRIFEMLVNQGFQATYHDYFYGCASGVSGVKP